MTDPALRPLSYDFQSGRECLASYSPSPFRPLMELLYSDKKPGELASRQCIIEIIHGLFEVFPPSSSAPPQPVKKHQWRKGWSARENYGQQTSSMTADGKDEGSSPKLPMPDTSVVASSAGESSAWESPLFNGEMTFVSSSSAHSRETTTSSSSSSSSTGNSAHALVSSLLIGPPNEKEESKHDFMQNAHRVRTYRLWIQEIDGVINDYFWVFCHSGNTYWRLQNLEEDKVEEPKVPGGMTGGVEYEAMGESDFPGQDR